MPCGREDRDFRQVMLRDGVEVTAVDRGVVGFDPRPKARFVLGEGSVRDEQ
jgi:hypothetical protein